MAIQTVILAPGAKVKNSANDGTSGLIGKTENNYGSETTLKINKYATSGYAHYTFDTSPIPANATIVGIKCRFLARRANDSVITQTYISIRNNGEADGETLIEFSNTTEQVYTFDVDYNYTRDTLESALQVRLYASSSNRPTNYYEALHLRYVELIVTYSTKCLYIKKSNSWKKGGALFSKASGTWTRIAPEDVVGA